MATFPASFDADRLPKESSHLTFPCATCDRAIGEDTEFQCEVCGDFECAECFTLHSCPGMATEPCGAGHHRAPKGSVLPLPCDCDVMEMCQVCAGAHCCGEYRATEAARVERLRSRWSEAYDMAAHELAEGLVR